MIGKSLHLGEKVESGTLCIPSLLTAVGISIGTRNVNSTCYKLSKVVPTGVVYVVLIGVFSVGQKFIFQDGLAQHYSHWPNKTWKEWGYDGGKCCCALMVTDKAEFHGNLGWYLWRMCTLAGHAPAWSSSSGLGWVPGLLSKNCSSLQEVTLMPS